MIEPSGSRFVVALGNLAIGVCRTWVLGSRVKGRESEMKIIYACVCSCRRSSDESIDVKVSSKYVSMKLFINTARL